MSNVKFELNREGVRELMQSEEAMNAMLQYATEICNRCPKIGYEADVQVGKTRAVGMVKAATFEARQDNLENNTLLKARY